MEKYIKANLRWFHMNIYFWYILMRIPARLGRSALNISKVGHGMEHGLTFKEAPKLKKNL